MYCMTLAASSSLVCMILLLRQVKIMQMSYDNDKSSVLVSAARNKSPGVFGAVLSGIEKDLSPQEVRNYDDSEFIHHMFEGHIHPLPAHDARLT